MPERTAPATGRTRRSRRRAIPARPSCSTSASRGRCPTSRTTPCCWPRTTSENIAADRGRRHPREARRCTCSTPARTDPTLAPAGPLHALHAGAGAEPAWRARTGRRRRRATASIALDRLKALGLPDLRAAHPLREDRHAAGLAGRLRGRLRRDLQPVARTAGRCCTSGPRNRFREAEGVYLVGGGTHPGSGLPVIYEGARISTRC